VLLAAGMLAPAAAGQAPAAARMCSQPPPRELLPPPFKLPAAPARAPAAAVQAPNRPRASSCRRRSGSQPPPRELPLQMGGLRRRGRAPSRRGASSLPPPLLPIWIRWGKSRVERAGSTDLVKRVHSASSENIPFSGTTSFHSIF
jgi:hypothetical protein